MAWLTGQRSMPFGPNGEHATVRLIDFDHPDDDASNQWIVSTEVTFTRAGVEKRFDLVLWSTASRWSWARRRRRCGRRTRWFDGAAQIHDDYEQNVPELFVPNVFSFATEGKDFRYGSVGMPVELWGPWREEDTDADAPAKIGLVAVQGGCRRRPQARGRARHPAQLHALRHRQEAPQDQDHRPLPAVRGDQPDRRPRGAGQLKKGLIWHFQGSGKSLLMVFAAQKLRCIRRSSNPTVLIVVDRIDLDTQITGTFNAADMPEPGHGRHPRRAAGRCSAQDVRKIIITTIHKFGEADGRAQRPRQHHRDGRRGAPHPGGRLGRKMREALPNAFLFGLTGTPINRADRNTFCAFGADEDEGGYMSRYWLRGVDPRRRHAAAALRAAPDRAPHRQGGDRRGVRGARRGHDLDDADKTTLVEEGRHDRAAGQDARADPRRSAPTSPSTSRTRSSRTASRRRSSPSTGRAASPTRRSSTSTARRRHRHRDVARPRRRRRVGAVTPDARRARRSCSTASATRPTR